MILKMMNYSDFRSTICRKISLPLVFLPLSVKSDKFLILVMTCLRYEICFDALEKVLARILSRITTFNAGLWLFT